MVRGQIVALPTEVIPPENTPEKERGETLIAHPRWRYIGPADTIRFEWQIGRWNGTFDGITARKYTTKSQPASAELKEFTSSLPSISLSPLSPGYYDCEIWFKDKFADLRVIVKNCVKVYEEAPPVPPSDIADWDFRATGGTYELGDRVTFSGSYKYKGKAQSGWLTISLGTGIYPSFFTKYTFSRRAVSFDEAMDWTPDALTGSFILPTTLEPGQTYSVRAKLETADGVQETDTDWGIITIAEAPPVGISFSVELYNTLPWARYMKRWCVKWLGKYYGMWTDVSDAITLENVEAVGAMTAVIALNEDAYPYTTPKYTLGDGKAYRFNVESKILEEL